MTRRRLDPVMILGVRGPNDSPVDSPLFAAVLVTRGLLYRLRLLSRLCRTHRLAWLTTYELDLPVYWDVPPGSEMDGLTDMTTIWNTVGEHHYGELQARMPLSDGEYSLPCTVGTTTMVDTSEFEHLRNIGYPVDFWEWYDWDEVFDMPFEERVSQRLTEMGLWPDLVQNLSKGAQVD